MKIGRLNALFYLMLIVTFGCNKGYFQSTPVQSHKDEMHISNRINHGVLKNGVKYYFLRNDRPKQGCFLRLNVSVGSFYETDNELGMAHTIEHLAFDDRAVSKDVSLAEWFQKRGMAFGPDANAYTSGENTLYQIDLPTCNTADVVDGLFVLRSFADGLQFKAKSVAKEANIIDAEEREYENSRNQLQRRIVEHLYSGTAHAVRTPLGKKAVRHKFGPEMIKAFYQKWYHPENLSVVIVGDYGNLAPADLIDKAFASLTAKSEKPKLMPLLKPDHKHPAFVLHEAEMPFVEVAFSIQPREISKPKFSKSLLKDRLAFELALEMLRTAYLKLRLKSDQLRAPQINGFMLEQGIYNLTLSVPTAKEKLEQEFIDAFKILRQAADFGFSQEDFMSAKAAHMEAIEQRVKSETTFDSRGWVNRIVRHINQDWYANDASDYQVWIKPVLANLSAEDCQKALKNALKSGYHHIFALGAIEESKKNVAQMTALLEKAHSLKVEPKNAEEKVSFSYSLPICNHETKLAQEKIASLKATKVRLKNNWDVILKPTQFKKDEILLRLFSDQGSAAMTKDELTIGQVAMAVLLQGGLKKHPPEQIPGLLQDKFMHVRAALHWNAVEASLFTRNKDLRFSLEYLSAYIDEPLYAEAALSRYKEETKLYFANLTHDLWEPLNHDFLRALTGDDFRVGHAQLKDILRITRDDLIAWHQKFIRHAKISVVVVGDFETTHVVRELNCVLGGFATTNPSRDRQPPPLNFKPGIHKTYEVKTTDATSKIVLRYPMDLPKQRRIDHRLALLRDIIQESLRLELREKQQVIYSPFVQVTDHQEPQIQNWLEIAVSVPKSRVATAQKDVEEIIGKLASTGITDEALHKAREPYAASMSKLLEENTFWAYALSQALRGSFPGITSMIKDIKSVKTKNINKLLQKYFVAENASSAITTAIDPGSASKSLP